jgi:protein SCO1
MTLKLPIRSSRSKAWGGLRAWSVAGAALLFATSVALGQVSSYGDKQMGDVPDQQPQLLSKVTISQNLNHQIPLDGQFVDETGKSVRLGDYFGGKRPVILTLVYYQCKVLCPEEMNGLTGALEMVDLKPGKDFEIVTVSIDPTDTPAEAASEKRTYLKRYGHPETADGWHYLTGQQPAINALAKAMGISYVRVPGPDGRLAQFAHASSIQIITPEGKMAQYYLGVEYSPKDLRLGLVEASHNQIGSIVDNILTYCYHYDPLLNKHSLVVARIVQLGGVITVLSLGSYMTIMFRRDIRQGETNRDLTETRKRG